MNLNSSQEEVASALRGRVVALAGPGSGKTRVLIERIRRLLRHGAEPETIAAVTFTVRAAAEMESRLAKDRLRIGFAGTLHGLARRILTQFAEADGALGPNWTVLDEQDRFDVLADLHRELRLKSPRGRLYDVISALHRIGGDPLALPDQDSTENIEARALLVAYRERKARLFVEDFDGLIDRARLVLLQNPSVAATVHRAILHLSVDEAQDLDAPQDDLLELVCPSTASLAIDGLGKSLLFVGDPLQSIYGWRGGDPSILLERAAEAHVRVMLGENYRSLSGVVDLTNRVSRDDPLRPPEYRLSATRTGIPPGGDAVVRIPPYASSDSEAEEIARYVRGFVDEKVFQPKEIAVLARTNLVLARAADALRSEGVPCRTLGERRDRIRKPWLRGAISYLEAALNPANDYAVSRALGTPALDLEPDFWTRFVRAAAGGSLWSAMQLPRLLEWAKPAEQKRLTLLREQLAFLVAPSGLGWSFSVDEVWGFVEESLRAQGLTTSADDVGWLRGMAGDYVAGRIPGGRVGPSSMQGLAWWLLFGQGPGEHDPNLDAVTLSTVHLAKGLEWRCVVVPGLTERGFPSSQAVDAALLDARQPMDEERRCFFVAVSRASDLLVLTSSHTVAGFRGGLPFRADPSRFLGYVLPVPARGG